jgi:chemotaxis response regulator CheB
MMPASLRATVLFFPALPAQVHEAYAACLGPRTDLAISEAEGLITAGPGSVLVRARRRAP